MRHVTTKQSSTANGRPRIGLPLALGLAMVLSGCAVVAHSGPRFRAMSKSEHIRTACDLDESADRLAKEFVPSARTVLRPAMPSYGGSGMNTASSSRQAEYYNPTYRYVEKARDLRVKAKRHIAAAGRGSSISPEICAADTKQYRSYGGSWFWW